MAGQKLNLSWDSFDTFTSRAFKQLWNDQDISDVTLVTKDDEQIKAHKVILSSASAFFNSILLASPDNTKFLVNNISHKELQMVIQFIYLGQCEVGEEELDGFLAAGKFLGVEGLLEDARPINITMVEQKEDIEQFKTEPGEVSETNVKKERLNYDCTLCDYKTFTSSRIKRHIEEKHSENVNSTDIKDEPKIQVCGKCDFKSSHKRNLERHKLVDHIKFDCPKCEFRA